MYLTNADVTTDSNFTLSSSTNSEIAINSSDSNLTLQGSNFLSNQSASSSGGAIYFNGGNHLVIDSNFTSNDQVIGGSLYLIDGNLTIRSVLVCSSPLDGGDLFRIQS